MAPKKLHDYVSRDKKPSPLGKSIFASLRVVDVFWQYHLLSRGWGLEFIKTLGGHPVSFSRVWSHAGNHLQPYYCLIWLLSFGSTLKQLATIVLITEQAFPVSTALFVPAFNTLCNSANTLLSLWALASPAPESDSIMDILQKPVLVIGLGLYVIGILTEAVSEFQRKSFKQDPANKGKPYGGGLFSLATNINYGGYTLWRAGYALVAGGWPWGILTFGFFFNDFASRGVPVMDEYLVGRYGEAYTEIKARVKYSLFPGIY
ncbi:hypothetical protein ARAM_000187 [Aspergillus rambellii]|uniref:Uncharacterized protein n=1 Tax=Aspergillus rambellii TaxID=308745 RepID=A0A0F8ULY3_9EURO|nr:hypothetical protein ARAM_000187 [Aspergillus rambellii]